MKDNYIAIKEVTKQYSVNGDPVVDALDKITLNIRQGEFIGLLGMNGSGKSTLAKLLNGLIQPSQGKIYIDGLDTTNIRNLKEIRSRVGIVFQNPENQIISSIVEEDIAFGPENLGLSVLEVQKRVEWALEVMGIKSLRNLAPHLLSGGQKQRVVIASALAMRPECLILDEPTSMLDPEGREDFLLQLRKLNKELGITIILITHNIEDVWHTDRLCFLDKGKLILEGQTKELFTESIEKLKGTGFMPPHIPLLVHNLKKRGCKLDKDFYDLEGLVEELCQL